MTRRPFDAEDHQGPADAGERGHGDAVPAEDFREALSYHAAGVTVAAVRDGDAVHATTATSFTSVSADPPVVALVAGGNAQVLPFLKEGARFVVNLLRPGQKRLATVFADSFPVGPSPFPDRGDPVIDDALAAVVCTVRQVVPVADVRVVLGTVVETRITDDDEAGALVHFRRDYHRLP